jgi:hypothetical protein
MTCITQDNASLTPVRNLFETEVIHCRVDAALVVFQAHLIQLHPGMSVNLVGTLVRLAASSLDNFNSIS